MAFAVFVAVVSVFNYRWDNTYRSHAPRWSDQVARATVACQRPELVNVYVRSAPEPFGSLVLVPCHRLRDRPWDCDEPRCTVINGARATLPRHNGPGAGSFSVHVSPVGGDALSAVEVTMSVRRCRLAARGPC